MRSFKVLVGVAMAAAVGAFAMPAAATTVTIPDLAPGSDIFYGSGDASVTYSGVTFTQSSALGSALLFNVGSNYYIGPVAVLTSQQEGSGVANILIGLPTFATNFSVDYSTFNGSAVSFLLSNGASFTQASTGGAGYTLGNNFSVTSTPFNSVLVTSPDYVLSIGNITYTAGVPEPGAWAMMLIGFAGLGAMARSARRRAAVAI